jgi:hypothetical protein
LFWGQSICSSKASIEFIRRRERDGNPRDRWRGWTKQWYWLAFLL